MYLARLLIKGRIRYFIRQSFPDQGHFKSRDLFDLGENPTRYIHYPGGNSFYYDLMVEEAIRDQGVELAPDDLDRIFFGFLPPEIQRVITGFDRGFRNRSPLPDTDESGKRPPLHPFDKRRYHYLRFGHSSQRFIQKVPHSYFRFLRNKSRDELEHCFEGEERRLAHHELGPYMATIFSLSAMHPLPDTDQPFWSQLDRYFMDQLCSLNEDREFLSGTPEIEGLYPHLIRYALFWFDHEPARPDMQWQYIRDFIGRHRAYRPPPKTKIKIMEAETLFGYDWKKLKRMDGPDLTRIYRRLALKFHPDQGGDADAFRRLTQTYKALMRRKPKR
jgi:hypothetical protein